MGVLPRYQIELMNRERVHVKIFNGSSSNPEEHHYNRSSHEKDASFRRLCSKAKKGELTSEEAEELGGILFDMLFDEGARLKFLEVYDQPSQRQQFPLLVELTIDEKVLPELAGLPWEFLCFPPSEQRSAIWLSSNPHLCFLRRPLQHGESLSLNLKSNEKMKIAVVIADALPDASIHYTPIVNMLQAMTDSIPERINELKVVLKGTRKNIIRELRQFHPHLIHFIGHAQFTNRKRGKVALVDETPIGTPEWVSAKQFGNLFEPVQPWLKVVLLQACESAAGSQTSAFASIAAQVLSHRIPAVIAMQYKISNMAAECFARTFYRFLLTDASIDQAVQEARFAMDQEPIPSEQRGYYGYFATPVLFRSANDGQLWEGHRRTPSETVAVDHYYRSVDEYRITLKEAAHIFGQESTIARDRCTQYQEMLAQLKEDLSHLYETLDHSADGTKRLEYATLFKLVQMRRRVQELYEAMYKFCQLCPPPFLPLGAAYQQQRVSIGSTFQAVEMDLTSLINALKPYINHLLSHPS